MTKAVTNRNIFYHSGEVSNQLTTSACTLLHPASPRYTPLLLREMGYSQVKNKGVLNPVSNQLQLNLTMAHGIIYCLKYMYLCHTYIPLYKSRFQYELNCDQGDFSETLKTYDQQMTKTKVKCLSTQILYLETKHWVKRRK